MTHTIEVRHIIGTDSRGSDFDREFRALRTDVHERRRRVAEAFPDGDFPPITVEKLGDAYFVVDGHHRVAVARQRGITEIDAVVTELTARWHLTADADCSELIHVADTFLWISERQRALSVEHGPQQLPDVIRLTASASARARRPFRALLGRS